MKNLYNGFRKWISVERAAWLLAGFGLLLGLGGFINHALLLRLGPNGNLLGELLDQYYANISAELVSIAITVLVVDEITRRREENRKKTDEFLRMVGNMASNSHSDAIRGVEELRLHSYLENGSLTGMTFRKSNLSGAELFGSSLKMCKFSGANLKRANFRLANLLRTHFYFTDLRRTNFSLVDLTEATFNSGKYKKTDFAYAELRGAIFNNVDIRKLVNITPSQLVLTYSLVDCILLKGIRYDGRYRLEDDLRRIQKYGNDPEVLAPLYQVSPDNYVEGQQWADKNLAQIKERAEHDAQIRDQVRYEAILQQSVDPSNPPSALFNE